MNAYGMCKACGKPEMWHLDDHGILLHCEDVKPRPTIHDRIATQLKATRKPARKSA